MKDLTPTILAFLFFLVVTAGYGFLLYQVNGNVMRMGIALQGSETLTQRDAAARSIEAFLNETETERTALDAYVIKDADIVEVIELVERVAREEDVSLAISSVGVTGQDGWSYHERIDLSFSVDGSFARVTDFLAALEALPFVVRIEGGSLGVSGDNSWFASMSATFVKEKL